MAESHRRYQVRFEYCFDRLFDAKLEQVYDVWFRIAPAVPADLPE